MSHLLDSVDIAMAEMLTFANGPLYQSEKSDKVLNETLILYYHVCVVCHMD